DSCIGNGRNAAKPFQSSLKRTPLIRRLVLGRIQLLESQSRMKTNTNHPYRVLIADDQADIRDALRLLLKRENYETHSVASPGEALSAVEAREFDAVLIDLNYARDTTSGQEGLDLLSRIQMIDATLPVVVMTAWSSVEIAVEAMRRGARDFLQKPWENQRLLAILRTQIDLRQALRQPSLLEAATRLPR